MFSFNIDGIEQTLQDLEARFSQSNLNRIKDNALEEGADFLRQKIREAQLTTKRTGAMADEVTFSEPRWENGERVISIHWRGSKNRYAVVHLVENGFFHENSGRFIKPKAYGQIEGVLSSNQGQYINIVQNSIARQIRA